MAARKGVMWHQSFNPGLYIPINKHTPKLWTVNNDTDSSAYENSVIHKLSLSQHAVHTNTHTHTLSFLSSHPEKLVITLCLHLSFTTLSPLSVVHWSCSHWTHRSAFSADKAQPQDDNHIRAHNLFMVLPHISTPFFLLHPHTHRHTRTFSPFPRTLWYVNTGILVVMSF